MFKSYGAHNRQIVVKQAFDLDEKILLYYLTRKINLVLFHMIYSCKWEVGRFDWLAYEIHLMVLNELKFCQVFEAKAPKPPSSSKIANIKFF